MQFGGIATAENVPCELPAIGADLRNTAATGKVFHQLIARCAQPAVAQQLWRKRHRGLPLRHQMPAESQRVTQPSGHPAADRQTKARQPRDHRAGITRKGKSENPAETISKCRSRAYHSSINLIVTAVVPHGQVALFCTLSPRVTRIDRDRRRGDFVMALDAKGAAARALHRFGMGPRAGSIAAIASDPRGALLAELDKPGIGQIVNADLLTSAQAARLAFSYNQQQQAKRIA